MSTDDEDVSLNEVTLASLPGAHWTRLSEAEGRSRYDLLSVTDDSIDYDDLFGGDPISFFVHDGDLTVKGPLVVANDGARSVFVLEGSLRVDGALVIMDSGTPAPLWVRGELATGTLAALLNTHLFVEEDLTVEGELVVHLRDSGHLVVNGKLTTGISIASSFDGALYLPEGATEPLAGDELEARLTTEVTNIPNRPLALALEIAQGRTVLKR